MTDNEIIKALKCCVDVGCKTCPLYIPDATATCVERTMFNALDLIKRQKAKIEELETELQATRKEANIYKAENESLRIDLNTSINSVLQEMDEAEFELTSNARQDRCISAHDEAASEAIKEFAERLKKRLCLNLGEHISVVTRDDIDSLVKEMTEVEE